jgi:hypothetical protein
MFSVIINIYNKKTEPPTLMELFTATGKLKTFYIELTGSKRGMQKITQRVVT